MKHTFFKLLLFFLIGLFAACASGRMHLQDGAHSTPPLADESNTSFSIYIAGDAGELNEQSRSVMHLMSADAMDDTHPGMVLMTGDNVYPAGMPPPSDSLANAHSKEILLNQIKNLTTYSGNVIFIPGNHDWNEFKEGGLDAIKRQSAFLNGLGLKHIKMYPENGCGDPELLQLPGNVSMIILDSQWWLQDWNKEPDMNKGCLVQSRESLVQWLDETLLQNKDRQIIVAMHHPLFSQGTHGGHFTWREHLFPLSKVVKWLYLPLPVIGSIYPYYRSAIGHTQDIRHPNYRDMKTAILDITSRYPDVIFLAGHDHNLQYIKKGTSHFILSGAGSKLNAITNSKDLVYGHMTPGYMRLDVVEGKGILLKIFEVDIEADTTTQVFDRFIINKSAMEK